MTKNNLTPKSAHTITPSITSPVTATGKKIAFLGLGVMGQQMAKHLAQQAHKLQLDNQAITELAVYNRSPEKLQAFLNQYQPTCPISLIGHTNPVTAANNASVVFACLGNDDDVRQVFTPTPPNQHNNLFAVMAKNGVVIDHTTTSALLAKEMASAAKIYGINFLDAPVSGGEIGAKEGRLSIMVGGDEKTLQHCLNLLQCYGKTIQHLGAVGHGQLCKMLNQICIAGILQGIAEALILGEQAGLNLTAALPLLSGGAAQSWQLDNRAQTMLKGEFDFGFKVAWMVKDLTIALTQAKSLGLDLTMTQQVLQNYQQLMPLHGGKAKNFDTSSLIELLRHQLTTKKI